jgi:prepilin-type N-terminal cleavage/methylation domain-containing protein
LFIERRKRMKKEFNSKGFTLLELLYSLFIVAIICVAFSSVFRGMLVNEDVAIRALEKQGYSDIKIISHNWFLVGVRGCDGKDAAKFTARVKNPAGKDTEVFVCTGWIFKGATIRTD